MTDRTQAMIQAAARLGASPRFRVPQTHPDAQLIAACAGFNAVEVEITSYYSEGANFIEDDDERDLVVEPMRERQEHFLDLVCKLRAATLEGHLARALTAWFDNEALNFSGADQRGGIWPTRLQLALLREMTEEIGR